MNLTRLPRILRLETAAAIAVAALLVGHQLRPTAAPQEPARVATVDLERVFNSIQRYSEQQTKLKAFADELETKVKAAETTVKDLEAELESYQAGSDAQGQAIAKLQAALGEFRAVQQFANAKLEIERARALRETYLAIKDAARRLAETESLDYILLDDSLPEMDPANAQKTMQQISARRFIFASPKSDATDRLVALMNDEWKKASGG
jgi:Skp family chaperone for outer membrane proteins